MGIPKVFKSPLLLACALLACAVGGYRLYLTLTDGFGLSSISYPLPHHPEWEIPPLDQEDKATLQRLLNQPYTYLGKGAQSYAFASADQMYVLKFFKFKHLIPHPAVALLPSWPQQLSQWKQDYYEHKNYRLQTLFDGHHLAYTRDRDHSALVYIHLNPTVGQPLHTVLIDKLGRSLPVDLNSFAFVIQKKGATARSILQQKLLEGNVEGAWSTIRDMLDMLIKEYHRSLYDRDHGVLHNTGFVEGEAFHLDVGKLTLDPRMQQTSAQADDLFKVVHRILPWIHRHFPEHEDRLKSKIQAHISEKLGVEFKIDP